MQSVKKLNSELNYFVCFAKLGSVLDKLERAVLGVSAVRVAAVEHRL